jgi:hypothetical protein
MGCSPSRSPACRGPRGALPRTSARTAPPARTLPLSYIAALTHARIYWHAVRNDCFAEPDCIVSDGVRSFTIAPGIGGESRVLFGLAPRPVPIGYVLSAGKPRRKVKVGDVLVVITCRALPCHVNMRVTVSFGGRTRLRASARSPVRPTR